MANRPQYPPNGFPGDTRHQHVAQVHKEYAAIAQIYENAARAYANRRFRVADFVYRRAERRERRLAGNDWRKWFDEDRLKASWSHALYGPPLAAA